jgi:hypothetical protein
VQLKKQKITIKKMQTDDKTILVEVFAGTPWQVGMVKSLLEDEEIDVFLKDEIVGTLSPWWTAPGGAGSVKVMVSNLDYDKAKLIVDEYEKNQKK